MSKQSDSRIPTLDGWRAIAVLLVIGAHSHTMLVSNGSWPALKLKSLFDHAGYGVDIFFSLSGFLICTLLLREKDRVGTISLSRFYARRAFRILPPLFIYLMTVLVLVRIGILPRIEMRELCASVFFFRNYVLGTWYTGHFWSLAVEEHFYIFAPIFILLCSRKWALRITPALIIGCVIIRAFEYSHHLFSGTLIQFRTENRYDGLLWGCFLAFILNVPEWKTWLHRHLNLPVVSASFVTTVLLLTVVNSSPFHRTLVAMAIPVFVAFTLLHAEGWFGRFLEMRVLKWIGRTSYSLYLWQMLFLPEGGRPLGALQAFPLAFILPLLCATCSFYFVEIPFIRWGHRLAASPEEPSTEVISRISVTEEA